jgi:hypothetical protein
MYDRLLTLSLVVVGLGGIYLCLRGMIAAVALGARGMAFVWRLACSRRVCPDCRRLGERCPWCCDSARLAAVGALAFVLPVVAWPMMLWSPVEFSARSKWATALWSAVWLAAGSVLLTRAAI